MVRRPAPPRRSTSPLDQLAGQIATFSGEVRGDLARLEDRMGKTDARVDVGLKSLGDDVERELAHLNDRIGRFHDAAQRGIELVREELRDHETLTAEGAARGAAQGVANAPPQRPVGGFWSDWKGWAVAGLAFITAAGTVAEKMPKLIKMIEAFWKAAGGGA